MFMKKKIEWQKIIDEADNLKNIKTPLRVSIIMATYNHENFIAQAIESVLMQKVNFEYELLIGEDCSTDKTRDIIEKYHKLYPNVIKPSYREKNVGALNNAKELINEAKGEFATILDGDDYYDDALRLQKAVDCLDTHPDYFTAFSDVKTIDENLEEYSNNFRKCDSICIEDFYKNEAVSSSGLFFRNIFLSKNIKLLYLDLIKDVKMLGDYPLRILLANLGKMKYIEEKLSVYRERKKSSNESWSSTSRVFFRLQEDERVRKNIIKNLPKINANYMRVDLGTMYYVGLKVSFKKRSVKNFFKYASKCVSHPLRVVKGIIKIKKASNN